MCKHDLDMTIQLAKSKIMEPGREPREIFIRMFYIKCPKCKKMFKTGAAGIAHDPQKGIYRDPEEPDVDHILIPEKRKKYVQRTWIKR